MYCCFLLLLLPPPPLSSSWSLLLPLWVIVVKAKSDFISMATHIFIFVHVSFFCLSLSLCFCIHSSSISVSFFFQWLNGMDRFMISDQCVCCILYQPKWLWFHQKPLYLVLLCYLWSDGPEIFLHTLFCWLLFSTFFLISNHNHVWNCVQKKTHIIRAHPHTLFVVWLSTHLPSLKIYIVLSSSNTKMTEKMKKNEIIIILLIQIWIWIWIWKLNHAKWKSSFWLDFLFLFHLFVCFLLCSVS